MDIDFAGRPKKRPEEYDKLYPQNGVFVMEEIMSDKKAFTAFFQDLIDIMKYGFEKEEVRKRIIYFKWRSSDKGHKKMQLNNFISNLIFWHPLIDVDKVDLLNDDWIFDFRNFNSDTLLDYVNTKLLPVYNVDFHTKNIMVDDIYHQITAISHSFCLLMGMSVTLYDLHQLELRDPEVRSLMRDPVDASLPPHEIEQELSRRNTRMIEKLIEDPVGNDYQPFWASKSVLKKNQFKEYIIAIGFKSDINGNTVPILIDSNFLIGGLYKPSFLYLNAISGRKALILSKLSMGKPGAFSKKISYNSLASTLRDDYEECDSIATVDYYIVNDDFLKLLDGRVYYDADGNEKTLVYETDKHLIDKMVPFRSPATCNSKEGVCRACYGKELFEINMDMASAGTLAALKITEPVGQTVLSSKHSQTTDSAGLQFTDGFYDVFEVTSSAVTINSDSELTEDIYIRLNDVQVDEMDDSEYYFVENFDIVDSKGGLIKHVEELNGGKFYLGESLISMYKQKLRTRNQEPIFLLNDIDEEDNIFLIEVKNAELTEPLKVLTKILNTHEHMGATTISEFCQMFAEVLIKMGIKFNLVHGEMILRQLIRKKSNILEFPDFSAGGNQFDYQLIKLDESQIHNPSVLMSMQYGYLRQQLLGTELYEKTETSPFDPLAVPNISEFL